MFFRYREKSKRLGCLLLAAAMLLSLSGCGAENDGAEQPISSTESETAFGNTQTTAAEDPSETAAATPETQNENAEPAEQAETGTAAEPAETAGDTVTEADEQEDGAGIYSYLQGIKAYENGREWSGDWCYLSEEGSDKQFSSFGCAICCLANMYSTLTDDVCTPDQMYEWTKEYSDYAGGGAVSWGQISQVADHFGFGGTLCVDDEDYEAFKADVAVSKTVLVLVSSYYDEAIWQDLPAHYVNIWEYDPDTETVFLTDSGRPSHNRTRVSLLDIYHALDMADSYQYFTVAE